MINVERNVGIRARTEAAFPGAAASALARAEGATKRIPRARLRSSTADRVEVAVGMTFKSWGEVVVITAPARGDETVLRIESRSRLPTLVDWGKNQRNVETVLEGL